MRRNHIRAVLATAALHDVAFETKKPGVMYPHHKTGRLGVMTPKEALNGKKCGRTAFYKFKQIIKENNNDITSLSDDKFARGAPKLITASAIIEQVSV